MNNKCPQNNCNNAKLLAYLAMGYIIACILYLLLTRNIGTPFGDAIKQYPDLMTIKAKSVGVRSNIFYIGVLLAAVILFILRPFKLT